MASCDNVFSRPLQILQKLVFQNCFFFVNLNCWNHCNYFLTVEIHKVYHDIPPTTSFSSTYKKHFRKQPFFGTSVITVIKVQMSARFGQMADPLGPFLKVTIMENLSSKFQDKVIISRVRGNSISAPLLNRV